MKNPGLVAEELASVRLGDARLERRAKSAAVAIAKSPAKGFPDLLSAAELEGYYRLVNNERVTLNALLDSHVAATTKRLKSKSRVVIAHDTTDFRFSDEVPRKGLGPMDNGGQGFYAHFSLAVASRLPQGVVHVEPWVREPKNLNEAKASQRERFFDPNKESLRWGRAVESVEATFADQNLTLIHVMDRDADDYALLTELLLNKRRFVIRVSTDRCLIDEAHSKLKTFVRQLDVLCTRDAQLSARSPQRSARARKKFPPRNKRIARLEFAAGVARIRRPKIAEAGAPKHLELNVIHVREPEPPEGCEPIEWTLFTNEPIDSDELVLTVVDDYRARWLIEEFFKALKTGCAFERRQHESKEALLNALGILIPIAWCLLNLRNLGRDEEHSSRPASEILSATQLAVLSAKSNGTLGSLPTVRDAMLAIAKFFGGHLKSNGEPGWQVLGRGFEALLAAEQIWKLALGSEALEM